MRLTRLFIASLIVLFACTVVSAQTVKESDLLMAKKSGMSDSQIITLIQMVKKVDIDTSFGNLQNLKDKGISPEVIQALSDRKEQLESKKSGDVKKISIADPVTSAPAAVAGSTPQVAEPVAASGVCPENGGVSVRTRTGWKEVEPATPQPEIAKGAMKSVLLGGIPKVSNKWELDGATAPLKVGPDVEFCVRAPQATVRGITLAVLESHRGKREVTYGTVRVATGQNSGRDDKHFRPVNASKSPDGAIIVKLSGLEPGEYALDLIGQPQYDFSVSEGATLASN